MRRLRLAEPSCLSLLLALLTACGGRDGRAPVVLYSPHGRDRLGLLASLRHGVVLRSVSAAVFVLAGETRGATG